MGRCQRGRGPRRIARPGNMVRRIADRRTDRRPSSRRHLRRDEDPPRCHAAFRRARSAIPGTIFHGRVNRRRSAFSRRARRPMSGRRSASAASILTDARVRVPTTQTSRSERARLRGTRTPTSRRPRTNRHSGSFDGARLDVHARSEANDPGAPPRTRRVVRTPAADIAPAGRDHDVRYGRAFECGAAPCAERAMDRSRLDESPDDAPTRFRANAHPDAASAGELTAIDARRA